MNENTRYQIDVEGMIEMVKVELEKAHVLVEDVSEHFLGSKASKHDLMMIEANYKRIAAKLALIEDVLDNVELVMKPMEERSA